MSTVPTLLRFTGLAARTNRSVTAAGGRYALRTPQVSLRQGGIELELDRLRATSEYTNRKRRREGRDCADGAGEELGHCQWRGKKPLRHPIGRDHHSGQPWVLVHDIQLNI